MRAVAAILLLGLGACAAATGASPSASARMRDWATPNGDPPTRAEFAALMAACQDKAKTADAGAAIDGCLADLGLRRTP